MSVLYSFSTDVSIVRLLPTSDNKWEFFETPIPVTVTDHPTPKYRMRFLHHWSSPTPLAHSPSPFSHTRSTPSQRRRGGYSHDVHQVECFLRVRRVARQVGLITPLGHAPKAAAQRARQRTRRRLLPDTNAAEVRFGESGGLGRARGLKN